MAGFKIPGTDTEVPIWMIGAAALAGLGAWILSRNQPQAAQPSTAGIDAAAMAQNFDALRQELLGYLATNYGVQNGVLGGMTTAPTGYPTSGPNGLPFGWQPPQANPPPSGWPPAQPMPPENPPTTEPAPVPPVSPNPPGSPPTPPAQGNPPGPIQYPPWQPPTGGPGSGGGARVLHVWPGVPAAPSLYGFPDIAYLTSPANPGDFFTPPYVRSTRLQPATGSFIGGQPGPLFMPFHSVR